MKKIFYKNEEIDRIILTESGIIGFSWIGEEDLDLEIHVDWNGQEDLKNDFNFMAIKTKLVFNWVTNLKIDLDWGNTQVGSPEISSFSAQQQLNKTYHISIHFNCNPKIGHIHFVCNSFNFEIIEN